MLSPSVIMTWQCHLWVSDGLNSCCPSNSDQLSSTAYQCLSFVITYLPAEMEPRSTTCPVVPCCTGISKVRGSCNDANRSVYMDKYQHETYRKENCSTRKDANDKIKTHSSWKKKKKEVGPLAFSPKAAIILWGLALSPPYISPPNAATHPKSSLSSPCVILQFPLLNSSEEFCSWLFSHPYNQKHAGACCKPAFLILVNFFASF